MAENATTALGHVVILKDQVARRHLGKIDQARGNPGHDFLAQEDLGIREQERTGVMQLTGGGVLQIQHPCHHGRVLFQLSHGSDETVRGAPVLDLRIGLRQYLRSDFRAHIIEDGRHGAKFHAFVIVGLHRMVRRETSGKRAGRLHRARHAVRVKPGLSDHGSGSLSIQALLHRPKPVEHAHLLLQHGAPLCQVSIPHRPLVPLMGRDAALRLADHPGAHMMPAHHDHFIQMISGMEGVVPRQLRLHVGCSEEKQGKREENKPHPVTSFVDQAPFSKNLHGFSHLFLGYLAPLLYQGCLTPLRDTLYFAKVMFFAEESNFSGSELIHAGRNVWLRTDSHGQDYLALN